MAASRAAATSLAGRAVHIKIHPRPRNLHESRQILRVLERFGEVVMYKNLRVGVSISPTSPHARFIAGERTRHD